MEPKKKDGRGRPSLSPASRKASVAVSKMKYREKKKLEKDEEGLSGGKNEARRIRMKNSTFERWRALQVELGVRGDDQMAAHLLSMHHGCTKETSFQQAHTKEEGMPFVASSPGPVHARGDSVSNNERHLQDSSSDVLISLPSPIRSNYSVQLDKHDVTSEPPNSPPQSPSQDSQCSSDDFNLSVSFMEKGDYIYPHEKEEAVDNDYDSDYEADSFIQLGNGDNVEGLQKVGEEEEVLGDIPEGPEEIPPQLTRSGLHRKCNVEEAAAGNFFIISQARLEALALEACSACTECNRPMTPKVSQGSGTAAHVSWICPEGHSKHFCTQETINRSHIGDVRLASAILISGNNFAKVALMARFCRLNFFSASTFAKMQNNYMFPAIEEMWTKTQREAVEKHSSSPVVVCGDARNDSPGHCAQYCTYTLMEHDTNDVLHVGFVDKRQTASKSPNMEAKAFKDGLGAMLDKGLEVEEVVTDAHPSIAKYMRESRPGIKHSWDTWHGAKNLGKKLSKASSKAATRGLLYWIKHVINHFWYCSKTCERSAGAFKAKWHGLTHHVTNQHTWVAGLNGPNECEHGPLQEREEWLKPGSDPHKALVQVCYEKKFMTNLKYFSSFRHTSMLESLHNHILMYASKRFSFQYPAYRARNLLAILDFMAHKDRADQTDEHGNVKRVAVWSKHSNDYVTKRVKVPKDYNYVDILIKDIFTRRASDEEPMFRRTSLRFDDPRLLQPRLAPFSAPPVTTIEARKAGRLNEHQTESEVD